jgi:hypothetical protein
MYDDLRGVPDEPVAEIVQGGEPTLSKAPTFSAGSASGIRCAVFSRDRVTPNGAMNCRTSFGDEDLSREQFRGLARSKNGEGGSRSRSSSGGHSYQRLIY